MCHKYISMLPLSSPEVEVTDPNRQTTIKDQGVKVTDALVEVKIE